MVGPMRGRGARNRRVAFAAREVPVLAVLVAVVGGLAGLLYLVTRSRGMSPLQPEQEREKSERFLRDIPPPP